MESFRRKWSRAFIPEGLTDTAVPKTRRPRFELQLKIIDLNNVPLVSGTSFIKWHLPHSTAAEHRGRTDKFIIKDHKVSYEYEKTIPLRMTIDKNGMMQDTPVHFEVLQEYSSGGRGERIQLGNVKLNLAEYVEPSDNEGEDGVCRRYLMQDSKINSTLKIGIFMKQLEGDRNFSTPQLKGAPVFGGIAGIMAGEQQGESDDVTGHMPSLNTKSRETGELQDMYRRTLAAYWAAQPGELKADECIEDIFAGGDGWEGKDQSTSHHPRHDHMAVGESSDGEDHSETESRFLRNSNKPETGSKKGKGLAESFRSLRAQHKKHKSIGGADGVSGRSSIEQQANQLKVEADKKRSTPSQEVDELSVREDLRSWRISSYG
ncbi:hypothetical protein EV356DRAFT_452206 [Viridothelium virens]|uniref:C2 NT-type domain-containing protein n=1 Tax=Viridothelium virens TaxID=1048519 RepID=A0A6A6GZT3_VIRVR|nr:hypothetical protein EV356DRAFT_452206 [Viridothelium virens]